ncbi:MAG TPA: DUF1800 domain-containing protein [Verrucomicrobiae bacterium]|nr:DUF1800 domain-containing protein [Verrucomicrobiae bacterium]
MLRRLQPEKWNYTTAAHLLNRAGFGGTPEQLQRLTDLGLEKAVNFLVDFERIPDSTQNPEWAKPDPERLEKLKEMRDASPEMKQEARKDQQRLERDLVLRLRYWWLQQMATTSRQLQEKLALFWHGHFATSVQKVKNAYLMFRQNEIFRRYGSGNWLTLLTYASKDPAMLVWLDQAQSRKEHPNENFAREVMELFTLGEGHYTEKDITEAARALTGWSYERLNQGFVYRPGAHDDGKKTILGRTGNFSGDDVLRIIIQQPQSARFITRKLWVFFASENPPDALIDQLAALFRASGYEFKPLLRALFACEEFYAPDVMRQQVKSPVQWLISNVRMLERELPPAVACVNALRMLGQELLAPPNVKGWDGGLSWVTTNSLMNRYNFATFLVLGENPLNNGNGSANANGPRRMPLHGSHADAARLFPRETRAVKEKLAAALQKRFLQGELRPEHQSTLRTYLEAQGELDDVDVLHAIRLIMCTPEFQLT